MRALCTLSAVGTVHAIDRLMSLGSGLCAAALAGGIVLCENIDGSMYALGARQKRLPSPTQGLPFAQADAHWAAVRAGAAAAR